MKKILFAIIVLACASCQKEKSIETHPTEKPVVCDFNNIQYNFTKRSKDEQTISNQRTSNTKPDQPIHLNKKTAIFYLDFDGQYVNNPGWNNGQPFQAAASGLNVVEQESILSRVRDAYSPYNVYVTTDSTIYFQAKPERRMRCIVTESWEWEGLMGGVAYIGSLPWGSETPCFVFSSLLGYNPHYIGEAAAHEFGHTVGLYHQSKWDGCTFIAEYNNGDGVNAPIMGISYYVPAGSWWKGYTSSRDVSGCPNWFQDDNAFLTLNLGLAKK